jgi:hypothetical protein
MDLPVRRSGRLFLRPCITTMRARAVSVLSELLLLLASLSGYSSQSLAPTNAVFLLYITFATKLRVMHESVRARVWFLCRMRTAGNRFALQLKRGG